METVDDSCLVLVTEGVLVCWGERIVRDTVVETVDDSCLVLVTDPVPEGFAVRMVRETEVVLVAWAD